MQETFHFSLFVQFVSRSHHINFHRKYNLIHSHHHMMLFPKQKPIKSIEMEKRNDWENGETVSIACKEMIEINVQICSPLCASKTQRIPLNQFQFDMQLWQQVIPLFYVRNNRTNCKCIPPFARPCVFNWKSEIEQWKRASIDSIWFASLVNCFIIIIIVVVVVVLRGQSYCTLMCVWVCVCIDNKK